MGLLASLASFYSLARLLIRALIKFTMIKKRNGKKEEEERKEGDLSCGFSTWTETFKVPRGRSRGWIEVVRPRSLHYLFLLLLLLLHSRLLGFVPWRWRIVLAAHRLAARHLRFLLFSIETLMVFILSLLYDLIY